jgi:hypothetical protein
MTIDAIVVALLLTNLVVTFWRTRSRPQVPMMPVVPEPKGKALVTPSGTYRVDDGNSKRDVVYNDDETLWREENDQ